MKLIKQFMKALSAISPLLAGNIAFWLFQRTPLKKNRFRRSELGFYSHADEFKVFHNRENLNCYEMGSPSQKMAVLIHGWESNAGSLQHIASMLVEDGYYVISIDLPAHGKSKLRSTNFVECSEAVKALLNRIGANQETIIISHSFGSAVTAQALSTSFRRIGKWILLTTPNRLTDIFDEFKHLIGMNDKSYAILIEKAEALLNEPLGNIAVEKKLKLVNCEGILLIHDKRDKVIPVDFSRRINSLNENTTLVEFDSIGHYRMLSNKMVLDQINAFIRTEESIENSRTAINEYAMN